jgi:hypothetical protein
MTEYEVYLTGIANVETKLIIEANSEDEAEKIALEEVEDLDFDICDEVADIEVSGCYEVDK